MIRLRSRLLPLVLTFVLAACGGGGGGGGDRTPTTAGGSASGAPVALAVQWPASLTDGAVQSASIHLPSRVRSLTLEVQVLAPDFAGLRYTVAVTRGASGEVTTVDGEVQAGDVNGLDLMVPVGSPRRFLVYATAEVEGAAAQLTTLHFTGFLDLTVTGNGDGGVVVLHEGDGGADGVPQVAALDLNGPPPGSLRVDSAAVDLGITATFSDRFQALDPPAAWRSDAPGVVAVDDTGLLQPAGKGSATLTVTVGGVPLRLPVTVENTPPRNLTTTDPLPPAGGGGAGIGDQRVAEDSSLTLVLAALDPDGDRLTFTATSDAPAVATAVAGTHLTLTPAPDFHGAAQIAVTADDRDGGVTHATFALTVTPVNDPPVVAPISNQVSNDQAVVSLAVAATDVDGDPLTFAATTLPAGLTLHAATGQITGTVDPAAARTSVVEVTVSDGQASASQAFTWQVNDVTAPVVVAPPDQTVEASAALTPVALGAATATDAVDGVLVAGAAPVGPFGIGVHAVTWSATDSAGNTATAIQTVTVHDTTPPAVTLLFPLRGIVGPVTSITVAATDLSGVTAVTLNGTAAVRDATDPDLWTATGVKILGLATPIEVAAADGAGNVDAPRRLLTTVDNGAVPAGLSAAPDLGAPTDLVAEADGNLVIVDRGAFIPGVVPIVFPPEVVRLKPDTGVRSGVSVNGDGHGTDFGGPLAADVDLTSGTIYVADLHGGNLPAQYLYAVSAVDGSRSQISGNTVPAPPALPALIGGGSPFETLSDVAAPGAGGLVVVDPNATFPTPLRAVDLATGDRSDPTTDPLFAGATCCGVRVDADGAGQTYYLDTGSAGLFQLAPGGAVEVTGVGPGISAPVDLAVAGPTAVVVLDGGGPDLLWVDLAARTNKILSDQGAVRVGKGPDFFAPQAVTVDGRGRVYLLGSPDGTTPGAVGCWGVWQVNPATGDRAWISGTTTGCGGL